MDLKGKFQWYVTIKGTSRDRDVPLFIGGGGIELPTLGFMNLTR